MSRTVALLVFAVIIAAVRAGNILLYPYGHCLNSHLLNGEKLANMLQEHGHQVDMVISRMYNKFEHHRLLNDSVNMLQFDEPQNYTPICSYDTVDFMMYSPIRKRFDAFVETAVKYCDQLLSDERLMQQLKHRHYDVFIMESLDPCSRILADYLNIPFIPLMTTGLGHWDGNPRLPSYLPAAIAPFTNNMGFVQRIGNFIMKHMYDLIPIYMGFDLPFEQLKIKYNLNTSLSISTTFERASIKLINSDFAIEYPAPVEPDSILIGGFSVGEPKPLSDDLEAFMRSAGAAGVIIMSTGTLVKSFNEYWTTIFADAFARLPQKVIWRYYNATNATFDYHFSDNIKLMKWLPQRDLLAHPQTRLFITHCGLNAMFEAAYSGVPVIAAPMSGDQMNNAAKLVDHTRMGVKVDMFSLTSDSLYDAIQTVLGSADYTHNALQTQMRIQDQPLNIDKRINYWVDYVIRYEGATHLRSSARKLSLLQYYSIDVILALLAIVGTIVGVLGGLLVCAVWSLRKHIQMHYKHKQQ